MSDRWSCGKTWQIERYYEVAAAVFAAAGEGRLLPSELVVRYSGEDVGTARLTRTAAACSGAVCVCMGLAVPASPP